MTEQTPQNTNASQPNSSTNPRTRSYLQPVTAGKILTPRTTLRRVCAKAIPTTLKQAVEGFLEDLHIARRQPSYVRHYRHVLIPFVRFTDDLPPEQVSEADVRAFLAKAREEGLSGRGPVGARRQNHLRDGLFWFFEWLRRCGY